MSDVACVLLVDPRGWVLLQERDEHPVVDPEKWGYPGGGIEPGETALQAAHRELEEETGIVLDDDPEVVQAEAPFWCEGHGALEHFSLFAAATRLTDADVVCGEGRQIVFVDPARVLDLDLAANAAATLPDLLGSTTYRRLVETAAALPG